MPAVSKTQKRLLSMALAYRHGKLPNAPAKVKQVAKGMDDEQLRHYTQTPSKDLPEKKASAVIVTGNPKYITNNPKAEEFYANLERLLQAQGYSTSRDPGAAHTEPAPADLWVGHSRGADRLRWAPSSTKTLALGSGDEGAINNPEDQAFLEGNEPGDPHFTLTPEMEAAIIARVKREPPVLKQLLQAKAHSDKKQYGAKAQILAALLRSHPDEFLVDSPGRFAGLTHMPTNFRIHAPQGIIPAGVKQANALQMFFAGLSKRRGLLGQVGKHFEANPQHAGWITQGPEKKPLLATFRDPSTGSNFSLKPDFTPMDFAKKLRTMRNSYRAKPTAPLMPKTANQMIKQAIGVTTMMDKLRRGSRIKGLTPAPPPALNMSRAKQFISPQPGAGPATTGFKGFISNLSKPFRSAQEGISNFVNYGFKPAPSKQIPALPENYGFNLPDTVAHARGGEAFVSLTPDKAIKTMKKNRAGGEMFGMTRPMTGNFRTGFDMGLHEFPGPVTHDLLATRNLVPGMPKLDLIGRTPSGRSILQQPRVYGEHPETHEVRQWMRDNKVRPLLNDPLGSGNLREDIPRYSGVARVQDPNKWFGLLPRSQHIAMADMATPNFIKTPDGRVVPIDVMTGRLGHLEAAKHIPEIRRDLMMKMMGGAALVGGGAYGASQLGNYAGQR